MDKVQKSSDSARYTPSSEPFGKCEEFVFGERESHDVCVGAIQHFPLENNGSSFHKGIL
jgi:hypothetical protein